MKFNMTDIEIIDKTVIPVGLLCEMVKQISDDTLRTGTIYSTLKLLFRDNPVHFLKAISYIMDEYIEEAENDGKTGI